MQPIVAATSQSSPKESSSAEDSGADSEIEDDKALVGILKTGKGRRRRKKRRKGSIRWSIDSQESLEPQNAVAAGSHAAVVPAAAANPSPQQGPPQRFAEDPHGAATQQATPVVGQVHASTMTPSASAFKHPTGAAVLAVPQGTPASAIPPSVPAVPAVLALQQVQSIAPQGTISNVDRRHAMPAVSNPAQLVPAAAPVPVATTAVAFYYDVIPAPENSAVNVPVQPIPTPQGVDGAPSNRCPAGITVGAMLLVALAFATMGLLTFFVIFTDALLMETNTGDEGAELTPLTDIKAPPTNEHPNTPLTTPATTPTLRATPEGSGIRRAGLDRTEDEGQEKSSSIGPTSPATETLTPL